MNPKDMIRELFRNAGAEAIVHLDDVYSPTENPVERFGLTKVAHKLGLLRDEESDGPEELTLDVDDALEKMGEEELTRLMTELCAEAAEEPSSPFTVLAELFGDTIYRVFPGSNEEATFEKVQNIIKDTDSKKTIVFLDDDLGDGQRGSKIAVKLLETDNDLLGLFLVTHHAKLVVNEQTVEEKLETGAEIVVLAKSRFSDTEQLGGDPMATAEFAKRIRKGMVATRIRAIKSEVLKAIGAASQKANDCLNDLSLEELDYIVARTAATEGAWLGDLLMRILLRSFDHEGMLHLRTNTSFHDDARTVSRLCDPPFGLGSAHPNVAASAVFLQRHEMFVSGDVLREASVELRAGDIFETGKDQRLILLGQACDLAVRGNGLRHDKYDLDQMGWVASVVLEKETTGGVGPFDKIIPYLDLKEGFVWRAKMSRNLLVPLWILDLAVFNGEGECQYSSGQEPSPTLVPSWRRRFESVEQYASDLHLAVKKIRPPLLPEWIAGLPRANKRIKLKHNWEKNGPWTVDFGMRRVSHLEQKYSEELLRMKASYLMRWAEEKDLSDSSRPRGGATE